MNGQVEPENWTRWLGKFIGHPVKAMELGCFNGTSSAWLLEHILTHPDSSLLCVDSLEGIPSLPEMNGQRLRDAFDSNTQPWRDKVQLWQMRTVPALGNAITFKHAYDFFYIDASHVARDVLFDACACYRLGKPGSVIMFDDYGLNWDLPDLPCRVGVDAFVSAHRQHLKILEGSTYQYAVEILSV